MPMALKFGRRLIRITLLNALSCELHFTDELSSVVPELAMLREYAPVLRRIQEKLTAPRASRTA
jgi:hypothetical protein